MPSRRPLVVAGRVLAASLLVLPIVAAPAAAGITDIWGSLADGASKSQRDISTLYDRIFWIALVVFVFVESLLFYTIWRFRGKGGQGHQTHEEERHNTTLEVVWTIIPAAILVFIGVMSFQTLMAIDTLPEEGVELTVIGHQWFWEVDYGDEAKSSYSQGEHGELTGEPFLFPVGENIKLTVTSVDSQHALWIPELGVKIDAYPRVENHAWFVTDQEGTYFTQCAEYCGLSHAYMRAEFKAVSRAEYERWLRGLSGEGLPVEFKMTDTAIEPATAKAPAGVAVMLRFINNGQAPHEIVVDGIPDATTGPIAPGETGFVTITPEQAGPIRFGAKEAAERAGGLEGTLEVVQAERVKVEVRDFELTPPEIQLKKDTTYIIEVVNAGPTTHNLYVGHLEPKEVLASSANLDNQKSTEFVFTPTEAGTLDMWCDISGHHQLGMRGTVVVS